MPDQEKVFDTLSVALYVLTLLLAIFGGGVLLGIFYAWVPSCK